MKRKTAKRLIIFSTILLIILSGILVFSILNQERDITGKVIMKYSYTKAICNENNFCQDYEIYCENSQVVEMNPITGAVIQHSSDWIDSRDKETINKRC